MKQVFTNPWVRAFALVASLAGVAVLCYLMSQVLIPLFFAFLVAYIFDPVADWFEARKRSRIFAIVLIVLAITAASLLLPLVLLPSIMRQADEFMQLATTSQHGVFDQALERLPLREWAVDLGWLDASDEDVDERQLIAYKLGELVRDTAENLFRSHAQEMIGVGQKATATAAEVFSSLANAVMAGVLFIGNFALFAFVAIYLLNDYDHIVRVAGELIPPRFRRTSYRIFGQIDQQLRGWLRGQLLVCAFLGGCYAVGFTLSGVPFGLTLALLGGAASFVPFLGIAITIGPAVLFCLLEYGIDWHVAGALATLLIAQGLEGNVFTPRIMGNSVGLSPVWVILAIMVFGSTLGFIGLLFAVPLAAVLKVLVVEAAERYRGSEFFLGEPVAAAATPSSPAPAGSQTARRRKSRDPKP
ncbi:MAG: AI-2E family transporter [Candidatus Hydrogenedens sp.]|nr:AI-2E family transporter [Candidatus Hydrogenedens sp.]